MAATNSTEEPMPSSPDVSLMEETQYRAYDGLIATGFFIGLIIGFPGNCVALIYFIQSKKRNLSTLLYKLACSIDIVSCVIHVPIAINLLNRRKPGLLGYQNFCLFWYITTMWVQLMSAFVVLLISFTRALAIRFPFYKIQVNFVVLSIFIASLYNFAWMFLYIFVYGKYYYYSRGFGYCDFYSQEEKIFRQYYRINYSICMGIPSLLVFLAFMSSFMELHKQKVTQTSQRNNRQSSITILYFTVLYLVCNILPFLNNATIFISKSVSNNLYYPGTAYNNTFMFFYSWIISELFCTVLNASLNPVIYLFRMKNLRSWLFGAHSGGQVGDVPRTNTVSNNPVCSSTTQST